MMRRSSKMFVRRALQSNAARTKRNFSTCSLSVLSRRSQRVTHRNTSSVILIRAQKRYYDERVIDHYNNPRNVGTMDKNDPSVGTGLVGAPACGDVMRFQIKVDEDGNIIDSCFKTFGCGSAIASSSFATEKVKGMSLDTASKLTNKEIAEELCLPPVKLHCSMLAEDAIQAAIQDYQKKKGTVREYATEEAKESSASDDASAAASAGKA